MYSYYQAKVARFTLVNIDTEPITIIAFGKEYDFIPGERKRFRPDQIRLYLESDGHIHTGCLFLAVEVDGKCYWRDKTGRKVCNRKSYEAPMRYTEAPVQGVA